MDGNIHEKMGVDGDIGVSIGSGWVDGELDDG